MDKNLMLERKDIEGGGVAVETLAHGCPRPEEAYGDEYNDHLFRLSSSDAPVEDRLTWLLRPETLELEGVTYQGFSFFADAQHWRAANSISTARKCILFAPAGKNGLQEHYTWLPRRRDRMRIVCEREKMCDRYSRHGFTVGGLL